METVVTDMHSWGRPRRFPLKSVESWTNIVWVSEDRHRESSGADRWCHHSTSEDRQCVTLESHLTVNFPHNDMSIKSPVGLRVFITFVVWSRYTVFSEVTSHWNYSLNSYWVDWTIVMQCWPVCHNLQLPHCSVAARLVTGIIFREPMTAALQQHWLPVQYRIIVSLCPKYTINRHHPTTMINYLRSRAGLRSASTKKYQIPRTRMKFGERSFLYRWTSCVEHSAASCSSSNWFSRLKNNLNEFLFRRAFLDSV